MCPVPKGRPSSAATATPDSHGIRGRECALAKLISMKLPAAPESINARESNCEFSNIMVTGTSSVDKIDELALTKDEPLEVGLVGQEILIWPGRPQYRHRFSRRLRSLSSDVRCVMPTCIGSGSGVVLHVTAEGGVAERRKGRLERIRLSIRMVSSINCSQG